MSDLKSTAVDIGASGGYGTIYYDGPTVITGAEFDTDKFIQYIKTYTDTVVKIVDTKDGAPFTPMNENKFIPERDVLPGKFTKLEIVSGQGILVLGKEVEY